MRSLTGIVLSLLIFSGYLSVGQRKSDKTVVSLSVTDTVSVYNESTFFDFPNVNKEFYYHDKKIAKKLVSLYEKQSWEELHPLLEDYIAKFGIVNFYKDTKLLWRLGKLEETYGNFDKAILLYKLVLKHHRSDINIREIELHYDSVTKNQKDYYVPLEYYYELVDYRSEVDTLRPPRSVLLNMGEQINSKWSDYGPTLSGDDNHLIFTSKRNSHYIGSEIDHDEDIFIARQDEGYWFEAEELKNINTVYNEGSATLSKDGKTLYFARCNSPDSFGGCDIFVADLVDSAWSNVRNIGINVNSKTWDSHPSLSHSEDTLYFASDRMGGFGLSDIYYTVKENDSTWSVAKNAGPIINTRNSEVSPFFHHEFNVLYFSSNGQNLNFGEFDIYKSYSTYGNWGEPKNIGPLVNGPGSEFYFTIDSKSEDLYYARSVENDMTNMDLYSFPLPMEAQPGATTVVSGSLVNEESGKPFSGIVSIIDLDNGIEVAPRFLRPDGSFEFELINNNNYLMIIQGDDFFRIEELFYLDGAVTMDRTTVPLASKLKFESIEFGNGISELTSDMYGDLDKLVDFMLDNPDFFLKISGHTDSDGREDFNLKLSQDRADAIKEYLVYFGRVEEERIQARGYGSSQPIVQESSDSDKKLNRRVEFELYRNEETIKLKN